MGLHCFDVYEWGFEVISKDFEGGDVNSFLPTIRTINDWDF